MDKEIVWDVLANRDHQIASATINWLNNCQSKDELNQALKAALLPLLACNGVFYGRLVGKQNTLQLLGNINQSACCPDGWKRFLEAALQESIAENSITGSAHMPRHINSSSSMMHCIGSLSGCQHSFDQSWQQSHHNCTIVTAFDEGHQPALRFYFCRLTAHQQIFSRRDIELLKILSPTLLQTLRFILFREETLNLRQVRNFWSDHTDPIVVIRGDGAVIFQSQAFEQIMDHGKHTFLSTTLALVKTIQSDQVGWYSFLSKLGKRLYEIKLTLIGADANVHRCVYLLHLSRITYRIGKIFNQLDRTGLTSRELEITLLICQGSSTREIAQEICLSYHTVRNHIKNIYDKLDVSTRSEMLVQIGY